MARSQVKAPQAKKPAGYKKLSGLGSSKIYKAPDISVPPPQLASLVDNELQSLTLQLGGDEKLAKRILKLKKLWPLGTYPELVTMDWLDHNHIKYEYQKWLLGGRVLRGGQVVDFAVDLGTSVMILEVQGVYWHTRPGKVQLDEGQRLALLGLSVWGKKIRTVVEVWDSRIMDKHKREQAFRMALSGIELGQ